MESSKKNMNGKGKTPSNYKYVDDNLQINTVNMETAVRGCNGEGQYRDKHGAQCQNTFRYIVRRAHEQGMKVNSSKTAMVCVSEVQSYDAGSDIFGADSKIISSGEVMKMFGFQLSSRPGVHTHVVALSKRMKRRFWVLYHLRSAGFTKDGLAKAYPVHIWV